jgi:hypothetical protein
MNTNSVHNKLMQFKAQEISLSEFQDLLESSSRGNKIRVEWTTLEGNVDYYYMWWDSGAYVGGEAGGSATKAQEGMFNIKTTLTSESGRSEWRTLDLQTVSKARFNNKLYKIK